MGDLKVWIIVVEKETKIEFFPKVANIQFFFEWIYKVDHYWDFLKNKFNYI